MLIKLPLHRKEVEEELVKMKEAVTASEEIISSVVPSVVLNNTDLPTMNLQVILHYKPRFQVTGFSKLFTITSNCKHTLFSELMKSAAKSCSLILHTISCFVVLILTE